MYQPGGIQIQRPPLDRHVAKPVARTYVRVVPQGIRTGVHNFFSNLNTPTVMINDALQGKFLAAANDLGRLVLNTTVGIGGLLDPATSAGLDKNDEDFGLTLGHWGVHAGPFLEIPLLGPSDLRDGPSRVVDTYTNPRQYIKNNWVRYGLLLPDYVDRRAQLLPLEDTLKNVYDKYAFIRDAYLANRAYRITGKSPRKPWSLWSTRMRIWGIVPPNPHPPHLNPRRPRLPLRRPPPTLKRRSHPSPKRHPHRSSCPVAAGAAAARAPLAPASRPLTGSAGAEQRVDLAQAEPADGAARVCSQNATGARQTSPHSATRSIARDPSCRCA